MIIAFLYNSDDDTDPLDIDTPIELTPEEELSQIMTRPLAVRRRTKSYNSQTNLVGQIEAASLPSMSFPVRVPKASRFWRRLCFAFASYVVFLGLSFKEGYFDPFDDFKYDHEHAYMRADIEQIQNFNSEVTHTNNVSPLQEKSEVVNRQGSLRQRNGVNAARSSQTRKRNGKIVRQPNLAYAKRQHVNKTTKISKPERIFNKKVEDDAIMKDSTVSLRTIFGGLTVVSVCISLVLLKRMSRVRSSLRRN